MSSYKIILLMVFLVLIIKKVQGKPTLSQFLTFITLSCLVELIAAPYFAHYYKNNLQVYNFFIIICVFYYQYLYYLEFKRKPWSKYLLLFIIIWTLFGVINYISGIDKIHVNNLEYLFGLLSVLVLFIIYIHNLLYQKEYASLKTKPLVWLSIGIVLFFISAFPILTFANYFLVDPTSLDIYTYLLKIGNNLLSLGYLSAAICPMEKI